MGPPLSKARKRDAGRPLWVMGDQCDGRQNDGMTSHLGLQRDGEREQRPSHRARPSGMLLSIHVNAPCFWSSFLREMGKEPLTRSKAAFTLCVSCIGRHALYLAPPGKPPTSHNTLTLFQLTIHIKIICQP